MFTGALKEKREMDRQLVASYFTVKSTDIFCSAGEGLDGTIFSTKMRLKAHLSWKSLRDCMHVILMIVLNDYHNIS